MATTRKTKKAVSIADGFQNVVANLGTARDKNAHNRYVETFLTYEAALAMYEVSWLAAAIVDYPAEDATRKWRFWRADVDQITKIEAIEKQLQLKKRVEEALIASRLYGGAAIFINTENGSDSEKPLRENERIKSLVVMTKNTLRPVEIVRDINSEYFGAPEFFQLNTAAGNMAKIHASRLVIFRGTPVPGDPGTISTDQWWGNSALKVTMDAVTSMDATMANMASLVFEAKVDVFRFKGFADLVSQNSPEVDAMLSRRLTTQAVMKGINGAVVIDAEDEYLQKSASFGGLPDVVAKFMDGVSGAARIPVTRLYGRAAVGLSGSGDGDERVYFDRVSKHQDNDITPALATLDDLIITQALGSRPTEIYYQWAPLRQQSETERADIFVKTANAARALAGTAAGEIIPLDALSDAVVNELTEQGVLPGLEKAIKEYGTLSEQGLPGEDQQENIDYRAAKVIDAEPKPLYVSRSVKNADQIIEHYRKQGIENLIKPEDMHVTITYSREPVQWMKMGEAWGNELNVNAGGARISEAFGPKKDTLVLSFASSSLSWRHEEMKQAGASWDWPEYQPHLSISYDFSGDANKIMPWQGEIKFGPEIFEAINENWKDE